jgi:hypothetical protein
MPRYSLKENDYNEVLRLSRLYNRQAKICYENKAYLASCILIGAALESILLAFVNCYPRQARKSKFAPQKHGQIKPFSEWTFNNLLSVVKERGWLPSGLSKDDEWDDAKAKIGDYAELIRQTRNFVHPIRYAIDYPNRRITRKKIDALFDILYSANDYLNAKITTSLKASIAKSESRKN